MCSLLASHAATTVRATNVVVSSAHSRLDPCAYHRLDKQIKRWSATSMTPAPV